MTKPTVAAFDFDGTLTYRDTLLPFICFCKGLLNTAVYALKTAPGVACFTAGIKTRQQVKEQMLTYAFRGELYTKLMEKGNQFAQLEIPKRLNPKALNKLIWHQKEGHHCVLLSATLDAYLLPWSKIMGFDSLLCSKMEADRTGIVTGKLSGCNCWGPEKVARLEKLQGPKENYILYAYGDSQGDRELLNYADFPFYQKFN